MPLKLGSYVLILKRGQLTAQMPHIGIRLSGQNTGMNLRAKHH